MFAQKYLKNMKAQKPGAKLEQEKKKNGYWRNRIFLFLKLMYMCVLKRKLYSEFFPLPG